MSTRRMRGGSAVVRRPNGSYTINGKDPSVYKDPRVVAVKQPVISYYNEPTNEGREVYVRPPTTIPRYSAITWAPETRAKALLEKSLDSYETSDQVKADLDDVTKLLALPPRPPTRIAPKAPTKAPATKMSYMMGGESPPANGYTVVTSVRPPTKTPKLTIGSRSLPLSLSPYLSLAIDTIEKTIGSIAPVNLDRDIAEYTKLKESQQKLIDTIAERIEELKTKELEQRKRVLAEADRYLTLAQTNKAQAEQTSKLLSDAYQRIIDYATRLPQRQKELQDKHAELIQKEAEEAAAAATEEAVEEANTGEVMEGGGRGKKVLAKRLSRKVRVLFRKHLKKLTRRR